MINELNRKGYGVYDGARKIDKKKQKRKQEKQTDKL